MREMLVLVWLIPMGCGSDETDSGSTTGDTSTGPTQADPCDAPFSVAIGTGEASYVPLVEGDGIDLTWGAQGGFHLWTSAKLTGIDGPEISLHGHATVVETGEDFAGFDQPDITMDISQPAVGGVGVGGTYNVTACTGSFWGQYTFVDTAYSPPNRFVCDLTGAEVEFSLDVTDLASGEVATSTVRLLVTEDPNPDSACNRAR